MYFQLQLASPDKEWDKKIVICDTSPTLRHITHVTEYTGPLTQSCWYTMEQLTNDTMYDIKLVAVNSYGESTASKVFSFYVTGTPGRRKKVAFRIVGNINRYNLIITGINHSKSCV